MLDKEDLIDLYKEAVFLNEAILKYGNRELVSQLSDVARLRSDAFEMGSIIGILYDGIKGLQEIEKIQREEELIYEKIKLGIIERIKNSELIALGFELPIPS